MYTEGGLILADLFHVLSSSLLALMLKSYHTAAPYKRHLPSNFIRQLAQLFADALGLFLVIILKQGVSRLIASIVSSFCGIAIVSISPLLFNRWGQPLSSLLVNISCWQLETWRRALQDCRRDQVSQGRGTCSWRESSGCGRWR